ncbi:hypothetical protein CMV_015787 [Castanea mollissima]|uniref:Uncharacterized protein n=1 Tax=Castanea mollissima TaxID=60419 RepID=A0A8J4QVS7_9ROSI|nr:hypothetical protein CMV_015787 [Castanea mollissima]
MVTCPRIRSLAMEEARETSVAGIAAPYAAHQKGSLTQKKSAVLTPNLLGRVMLAITAKDVYLLRQLVLWCILVSSAVECLFVLVLGLKSLLMIKISVSYSNVMSFSSTLLPVSIVIPCST